MLFLENPLHASNVFTFLATRHLVQDPIRSIPDVIGIVIQAKVAFVRVVKFLHAPKLQSGNVRQKRRMDNGGLAIFIKSGWFSWEENSSKLTLRNITLEVRMGEKVAVCGEVGSGKSTLLAAILGEVPNVQGSIQVFGKVAYVSQTAWIQTGTIKENILFGSAMARQRYEETLERCSLVKDLELFPFGDQTEIGERGVSLSGRQKRRIQLARALYQDTDIYLLDDPFSAVDAQTATSLFNEYVMEALSGKAVFLVTHQVDFLPAFDTVLLMSHGEILQAAPYHHLLASSQEFQDLVNAHKETAGSGRVAEANSSERHGTSTREIKKSYVEKQFKESKGDQLIKQEERERGDTGFKPYVQCLGENKGFLFFFISAFAHLLFVGGQILQNYWMAANVDNPNVSSDLSIVDLDVPFNLIFAVGATINAYSNLGVLAVVTWQVLFVSIPIIYAAIRIQKYYFSTAKELMRINGTTKSLVANHLVGSIAGAITIRAFEEEEWFFAKNLDLIDTDASPFFHNFSANEWLIQRSETLSTTVLASAAFSAWFCFLLGLSVQLWVEWIICDLQIRYRPDAPLVLRGITCTFQGGHKIGIVGRTGSGKTTRISVLFRLVEPVGGEIII
ncbi:hypothetical protein PTKIN_Ptkin05aG0101800 [Pterospermum kingtungense]